MFLNLSGIDPATLLQLQQGKRIRGNLGYSADGTLNFNAWHCAPSEPYNFIRLRHGHYSLRLWWPLFTIN